MEKKQFTFSESVFYNPDAYNLPIEIVNVNNTTDEYVLPWIEAVKEIAPREVMIYTIDRETPQEGLLKATHEELDRIVAMLDKEGIKASASY